MWIESDLGSYYYTEQCTSRFGNITDAFRVLGNLDPESLYLTKKTEPELSKAVFSETQQKVEPRTKPVYLEQSDALEQVQSIFCEK